MTNNLSTTINDSARFWIAGLCVVVLGYGIWESSSLLIIIFSSVVFSIYIEGLSNILEKHLRLPRVISIIFIFLAAIAAMIFLVISTIPVIIKELDSLGPFLKSFDGLESALAALKISDPISSSSYASFSPELMNNFASSAKGASKAAISIIFATFGGIINIVLLAMMSLYLALEERAVERLIYSIAPQKNEKYILSLWIRIRTKTEAWFKGQVMVACIVLILTLAGLMILKMPYAFLLAVLAGFLGFIPFGIVIAFIPAIAVALIQREPLLPLYVTILYGSIQYLTDYIVQPLVTKRITGIPPLLAIISVVISASLFGFLGFFLAVPISIFILEVVKDYKQVKVNTFQEDDKLSLE